MKTKILSILKKNNDFVSGQMLCDTLGVSRTAVWKVINQLKKDGYVIESVTNKGYRLIDNPDLITESEIKSHLKYEKDGVTLCGAIKEIVYYDEIDSTNNEAKRQAEKGEVKDGTLFVAECQTGGRGRRGRNWVSPPGSGIWMSLFLKPDISPASASMLTIVAAMAVTESVGKIVKELGEKADCKIKWPNDLVLNGKKICGILTEMSAEVDYIHFVVIGIGINVNTTDFDDEIKAMASSIYKETGAKVSRSQIIAYFSESFERYYKTFVKSGDLSGLVEAYNEMLINKDKEVKAIFADAELTGVAKGINGLGELIIETKEGERIVRSGEVSVRGLYGYV